MRTTKEFCDVGRYFEWMDNEQDYGSIRVPDNDGEIMVDTKEDGRDSGVKLTKKQAKKLRKFLKGV